MDLLKNLINNINHGNIHEFNARNHTNLSIGEVSRLDYQKVINMDIHWFLFKTGITSIWKQAFFIKNDHLKTYGIICISPVIIDGITYYFYKWDTTDKSTNLAYLIYNHILNKYIWIHKSYLDVFIGYNMAMLSYHIDNDNVRIMREIEYRRYHNIGQYMKSGLYDQYLKTVKIMPYQSFDMQKIYVCRFEYALNIQTFINNRAIVAKLIKYDSKVKSSYILDTFSDIDILKLRRPDKLYNYKYIYQIDSKTIKFHDLLYDMINMQIIGPDKQKNMIFVPYLESGKYDKMNVEHLDKYDIYVINQVAFIKRLKYVIGAKFPNDDNIMIFGLIIFFLNKYMELYFDHRNKTSDEIIRLTKERTYTIDKPSVVSIIHKLNDTTKSIAHDDYINEAGMGKIKNENINCEHIEAQLYKLIYESNVIVYDDYVERFRNKCYAIKNNFSELNMQIDKYSYNNDILFENCGMIPLSSHDIFKTTGDQKCDNLYGDDKMVSRLGHLGIMLPTDPIGKKININEYLMPEWFKLVLKNDLELAFRYRQLIIGDFNTIREIKQCSKVVRADPWLTQSIRIKNISWSPDINRTILVCQLKRNDMIFPIRIIDSGKVDIYTFQDVSSDDFLFIGSFMFRYKNNQHKFLTQYIYWDNRPNHKQLVLYNHRSNRVIPGTFSDYIRGLYLEYNTLYYFEKDYGIKLFFYRFDDTTSIYVSRYAIDDIKTQYQGINDEIVKSGASVEYQMIDRLKECRLIKDEFDKSFQFHNIGAV